MPKINKNFFEKLILLPHIKKSLVCDWRMVLIPKICSVKFRCEYDITLLSVFLGIRYDAHKMTYGGKKRDRKTSIYVRRSNTLKKEKKKLHPARNIVLLTQILINCVPRL